MSKIFSWEYFSFLTLDDAVAYKEVLVIPILILVLCVVWMRLVKGETKTEEGVDQTKKDINFEQAYQALFRPAGLLNLVMKDAVLNEVDSGAEMDSQAEDEVEEVGAVDDVQQEEKEETDKKED